MAARFSLKIEWAIAWMDAEGGGDREEGEPAYSELLYC